MTTVLELIGELGIATDFVLTLDDAYTAQAMIITDRDNNQINGFHPGAMERAHLNRIEARHDVKLGIIARWKQLKSQPYAQELDDYEVLKEKLIARDKGATILKQGTMRMPKGATLAYPGNVPTS